MRSSFLRAITCAAIACTMIACAALPAVPSAETAQGVEGTWSGALEIPSGELSLVFNIIRQEDGTLGGTVDSPDQGATGIPISAITLRDDVLRVDPDEILPVPSNLDSVDAELIRGVIRRESQLIILLDVKAVRERVISAASERESSRR